MLAMRFSAWRFAVPRASLPEMQGIHLLSGTTQTGSERMATAARKTSARTRKADAKPQPAPKTPAPAKFGKEEELKAYRDMLLIRRFEEKAGQLYGMGFIGGFCHLYIGQEAVVTGMAM